MNILAIETSSHKLCVGLINNKAKTAEYVLPADRKHTDLLIPTIKRALARLRLKLSGIDYFAVGLGPGTFTGLRIGLSTVKGFAAALSRPVIGLPTLDVIAMNALPTDSSVVCPIIDAKRNLIFSALYQVIGNKSGKGTENRDRIIGKQQALRRISPYLLINVDELLHRINPAVSVAFLGDGINLYRQQLERKVRNSIFLNSGSWYPSVKNLIKLSAQLIDKNRISDAASIKPIYLYPQECQIRKPLRK